MGTQISDIVDVTITRETARILQAGFGVPLLLGPHFVNEDRTKSYSDPADMLVDGFLTTDNLYKMAVKLMSQTLSPSTFKVGRKLADINSKQTLTFDAVATAGTFTVTLGALTTAAIAYDANAATIKAAIELLASVAEVTVTGDMPLTEIVVEFTGADAATDFDTFTVDVGSLTSVTTGVSVVNQYGSAVESWTEALNNILLTDEDWYCLLATTRVKSEILELAAIIETKIKLYISCSEDSDAPTSSTTDTASELQDLSYDRTSYIYSTDEANFPEAAWAGGQLPENPGSITWKFKTLVGISPDSLTTAQVGYLKAKSANFYETVGGQNIITSDAVVASGEYIDIIRGIDWLQARIGEDVYAVFINSKKVPYTNKGVSLLANPLRARLLNAASPSVSLITEASIVVSEPDVANALTADKANRLLKELNFSATLQGAVHKVEINGKLSL